MDEDFILDLYSYLIQTESDYSDNQVPYEEFKQGLQDDVFSQELYNYLSTQDATYSQDVSLEEFQRNVKGLTMAKEEELLKKKEDTESSLEPSSSEPPTAEEHYNFMSTSDEDDTGIQEGGETDLATTPSEFMLEEVYTPSPTGRKMPKEKLTIGFKEARYPKTFENFSGDGEKLYVIDMVPEEVLQNYEKILEEFEEKDDIIKYNKERKKLGVLQRKIEKEYPILSAWKYGYGPNKVDAEGKTLGVPTKEELGIGKRYLWDVEKDKEGAAADKKYEEERQREVFLRGGNMNEFGGPADGDDDYEANIEKFINFELIDGEGFSSYIPGLDTTEEDAVVELRNAFGDLGFKFVEQGMGDEMRVTAPNGAYTTIKMDHRDDDKDRKYMNILKDFMRKNKPAISKDAQLKRYISEDQVKQDTEYISFLADNYGKSEVKFKKDEKDYQSLLASYYNMNESERKSKEGRLVQESLIQKKGLLAKQKRVLENDAKSLMKRGKEIDVAAGKYASLQKELGTTSIGKVLNGIFKGALQSVTKIASAEMGYALDIMYALEDTPIGVPLSPEGYPQTNESRFDTKKEMQEEIRHAWDTSGFGTQEAYEDLKENYEFWKIAYSVSESLPPMILGQTGMAGQFMNMAFYKDMYDQEHQHSAHGRDVDTREMTIYNSLLGLAISKLDAFGFGHVIKGTGGKKVAEMIAKIAYKDAVQTGAKISAKSFEKSLIKTIENRAVKAALTAGGSGATEFVTGSLQGLTEYTGKSLVNYFKDQKVYETPEFNSKEYWKGVLENGYYEMMGGLFMGVPIGIYQSMGKQNFSKMDNDSWELFKQMRKDPTLLKLSDAKFLEEIALGKSTPMMALKIKNQFKEASNLVNQIPNFESYTPEQQRDVMGLMLRRNELQNRIKGKDKSLSAKDNAEIAQIEQKLVEFSQTMGDVNYARNKVDDRFKKLKDDDEIEVAVESLDEVPTKFGQPIKGYQEKKTGKFEEVEVGDNVNGLPIGKQKTKVSGTYYTYTLTGKQINNAIQEQSTTDMDASQPTTNVQEVESGTSEAGPEVTATEEIKVTDEEKAGLNNLGFTDEMIEVMTPEDIDTAKAYTDSSQATKMVERYQQDMEAAKALAAEDTTTEGGVAGEVTEQNKGNVRFNPIQKRIIRQAQKAVQSLKKLMPNLRIITYATEAEYAAAVPDSKIGERGEISKDGNTIRINLATADETTVAHEIFHALITSKFNINSKKIATAVNNDLIKKLLKILPKDKYRMNVIDKKTKKRKQISLHQYLEEYVSEYSDTQIHSEEKLAQIFGFLGANYSTLTYQEQSVITKFFNKLRTLFGKEAKGIEVSKDEARVADLLNTLAYKVKMGEEIQEGDLELFDEVSEEVEGKPTETTTEEEVVEEAPVEEVVEEEVDEGVNAEIELEIEQVEFEIEESEQLIEEFQTEINNIKSNFKEDVATLKAKGKKFMKTDEYAEELEELKYSRDGNLESYNDDLKEARSDKRKLERRKKKLEAKLTPTSRKQVAAKESVAPMKVNEEFSKMTPAQKRKQLGGRYGILSLELRKGLFSAKQAYKYADEYERLRNSNKIRDIELFDKKYQQNPPMTEQEIFLNSGGWYRGVDGEYRYEIPDGKLVKGTYEEFTKQSLSDPKIREARLDEIYIAPEVYKTYPQIADIMVQFEPMVTVKKGGKVVKDLETVGSFSNSNQLIKINTNHSDFTTANPTQQRNIVFYTLLHEMQHAIQHIEGFALGSSPVESKAGRGKRVTEKFNQGKEDLTKERIFESSYHKDLRKKYETFRINKEFLSHFINALNELTAKGYNEEFFKLLRSGNKGKALVSILKNIEIEGGKKIYKELAADARYFHKEVSGRKIKMTQESLGNFLDKMLDFSALNGITESTDIEDVNRRLVKMLGLYDSFNMYERTYGEIESRNVEERARKKKELAEKKKEIDKVERLGKKKGVDELEKIERIEQLEEQLYRELPTVDEDSQSLIEGVNEELQGPYIMKTQPRGRMKKVVPQKQTQLTTQEENAKATERIEGMNRKQLPSSNASMEDIIAWGRDRGESDAVIRMFLKSRGYGTIKEIKEAMAQTVQMSAMPPDLANIEGGLEVAERLYEDVMTKFYDATMETKEVTEESKKRIAKAKEAMLNNPQEYGKEKDGVFTKGDKKLTLDITKAKGGVKIITATEVLGAPPTSMQNVFTKSKAQRRAILQQIIESNKDYQNQDEANKANIQRLLDRALNTRANPSVEQRMKDVRRVAKAAEQNEKKLQQVRNRLRALIRESIPKVLQDKTTTKNLNAMIKSLAKVTSNTVLVETDRILKEIERINKKETESLRAKTLKIIKSKARKAPKGKTTSVDADTNMFMQEILAIWEKMNKLMKQENREEAIAEYLGKIQIELDEVKKDDKGNIELDSIDEIIYKTTIGKKLNSLEKRKLFKNFAYDMMYNYPSLDYDGMQSLYEEVAMLKAEGLAKFKSNREARIKKVTKLRKQAEEQIKKDYPYLVDDAGNLMDKEQIKKKRTEVLKDFKKTRSYKDIKLWARMFLGQSKLGDFAKQSKNAMRAFLASNQTLNNALDKQGTGSNFFTKNIYQRLRDMRESYLTGVQSQQKIVNEILETIPGIESKTSRFKTPYGVLVDMLSQPSITINKKYDEYGRQRVDRKTTSQKITRDSALRIYALWQNKGQRTKLQIGKDSKGRGTFVTQNEINQIKEQLQPELIEFANKMIDYLSNDYYNSVNEVYMQVNDASLSYVDNYFPTQTFNAEADRNKASILSKDETMGDFNQVFNVETAPALHSRTNTSGRIRIDGISFTGELSSHFEQMEKFKAYAEGVKTIRDITRMDSVVSLLDATGLTSIYKRNLMTTINPNAFNTKEEASLIGKALNNFSAWALGFKLWQIPKQATSFINSFEDYESGLIKKDYDGLGITKGAADIVMYMIDMATTVGSLTFELMPENQRKKLGIPDGPLTTAYKESATFRDRVQQGFGQGDLWGLESGQKINYENRTRGVVPPKLRMIQGIPKNLRKAGASFTMLGDVLGVMGYMINYRRDLKNGMSKAEALRKFNRYEATQQTRGETEKNRLQLESNDYFRAFTMFGSTIFLQQNKIAQSFANISDAIAKGKVPRKQDIRSFYLNLGIANVAFVYMSNIFKYAFGDDEEKEEVLDEMWDVMRGLNSLKYLPFLGDPVAEWETWVEGKGKYPKDQIVNPFLIFWRKARDAYEEEGYEGIPTWLTQAILGVNVDPFVGLYNKTTGPTPMLKRDEDFYKMIGVSKSYRPKAGTAGSEESEGGSLTPTREELLEYGVSEEDADELLKE